MVGDNDCGQYGNGPSNNDLFNFFNAPLGGHDTPIGRRDDTVIGAQSLPYSITHIAPRTVQMVSPSTMGGDITGASTDTGSIRGNTNDLSMFVNARAPPARAPPALSVTENDSRSHNSRYDAPTVHAKTSIHFTEIPSRAVLHMKREFYVGLLGIPNPSDDQIEHKQRSIVELKNHANEWGRQYLKNEFVIVSNTIMSDYNLPSVKSFRDIKKMYHTFEHGNQEHVKAMSEIQYERWLPPNSRSDWQSSMELLYMMNNNIVYKKNTILEDKMTKVGCIAKLFRAIKIDLIKQLQFSSGGNNIKGKNAGPRGFVKKRKSSSNNVQIRTVTGVPYVNIYIEPPDDVSPLTQNSVNNVRELQKENSILQQKLSDMERLLNGHSTPIESQLLDDDDSYNNDWAETQLGSDEQLLIPVSDVDLCFENCVLLLYSNAQYINILMLLFQSIVDGGS
jgi:hypothetical protein